MRNQKWKRKTEDRDIRAVTISNPEENKDKNHKM